MTDTSGRLGLTGITLRLSNGQTEQIACDALGVSCGWNPNVALTSHHRSRPLWDDASASFVPGSAGPVGLSVAGAAMGAFSTAVALRTGAAWAVAALAELGNTARADVPEAEDGPVNITPFWHVAGKGRAWVDVQNDVTVKDIVLAEQENFVAVEHLKRYTTLGMATDQGKTSNVTGLAVMAELTGKTIAETGTTIYRPPYIVEVGMWLRAQWFPKPGETTWRQSVDREALATRACVGICDVTTLGKIDVQGTDAGAFRGGVYANTFSTLAVGKVRYGLMLREDGMMMDDGTTARLGTHHYVMTTTTADAVFVFRHLEFCRQCLWPDLDVQLISTTEAWAQYSVARPNARKVLEKLVDQDISDTAFSYMACGHISIGGLQARLFRISFSGELVCEIAVPTRFGDALIRALMAAGQEFGAVVYGTETLGVLQVEKGHAAGNELNGTTTALTLGLGLGKMVSKKKDAIGVVLSGREGMIAPNGLRLVGFGPVDPAQPLAAGRHFIAAGKPADAAHDEGYMTSVIYSPHVVRSFGLGLLKAGHDRMGERLRMVNPLKDMETEVEVVSPHFVDPEGERLRG